MTDALLRAVEGAVSSPWVYLLLFAIAALDGFFPVVPSETLVITLGVFAANGDPNLLLVIAVAAAGAFVGDHVSYFIGRRSGHRIIGRMKPGSRSRKAYDWVGQALAERGGLVLVVARYIPGGRTAATLTTGATGFPRRSFTRFDALAAGSWAIYSACIGYLGGAAFEHDPLRGLMTGLGLAFTITIAVEVVRWLRHRRAARSRQSLTVAGSVPDPAAREPESMATGSFPRP
ncbi:DedA family protein [Streptomyces sp. NPDC059989]|uniref:DedA family protein n=1 Tax=Streptomyces sp. NPDC059989 TaxID=3347026 RepID=UPI003684E10D